MPLQPRGCDQGPLRQGRALRPLRLKRAYPLREPLREERALRPLNHVRASRGAEDDVDHEAEAELVERQDELDVEPVEHLRAKELLVDRGVLASLDVVVLVLLVVQVLHWARTRTRGQRRR